MWLKVVVSSTGATLWWIIYKLLRWTNLNIFIFIYYSQDMTLAPFLLLLLTDWSPRFIENPHFNLMMWIIHIRWRWIDWIYVATPHRTGKLTTNNERGRNEQRNNIVLKNINNLITIWERNRIFVSFSSSLLLLINL